MQSNKENGNGIHPRTAVIVCTVLAAAALRMIPHPMNFAPIGALALFSGTYFLSKRAAVAVPLLSLLTGDIFTGFHQLIPYVYASFLVSVSIGFWLRRRKSVYRIGGATIAGAIQFFLITNFGMWAMSTMSIYPKTFAGLVSCYVAGIPYFGNTLLGDAFYAALLFGGFALVEHLSPALRDRPYVAV